MNNNENIEITEEIKVEQEEKENKKIPDFSGIFLRGKFFLRQK